MVTVSVKHCREIQNTYFMSDNHPPTPPYPKESVVYEIVLKNMVEPDRQDMTILYGTCALHAG